MEEEVERIVINIGIVSSDEECDEDDDRLGSSTDTADEGIQLVVQIKLRPLPRAYSYFWNKLRVYTVHDRKSKFNYGENETLSRAVVSWSKASCLRLALQNARWFNSSWWKKFSHEFSASVWDRCTPSIVMHLGTYDSVTLYSSGRQHSLKCAMGTRCCTVCTVGQQGEIESIPASSYGVHPSALRFPRVRETSTSVLCADDPCSTPLATYLHLQFASSFVF
ncbi:hypothetical protein ANN_24402 [Periplaneta americana]|uniref:Uncharacterized protein n=1 Tax=Periplaneta americana TaxID=6978 RepID=A0ABQ8S2Z6_PERAM|nr:hypothetical protein ANN_24402 [Periplaneta americana]